MCSATREAAIERGPHTAMKSGPHLLQLEKALAQKGRPNTAKERKEGRKEGRKEERKKERKKRRGSSAQGVTLQEAGTGPELG